MQNKKKDAGSSPGPEERLHRALTEQLQDLEKRNRRLTIRIAAMLALVVGLLAIALFGVAPYLKHPSWLAQSIEYHVASEVPSWIENARVGAEKSAPKIGRRVCRDLKRRVKKSRRRAAAEVRAFTRDHLAAWTRATETEIAEPVLDAVAAHLHNNGTQVKEPPSDLIEELLLQQGPDQVEQRKLRSMQVLLAVSAKAEQIAQAQSGNFDLWMERQVLEYILDLLLSDQ